MQLLSLHRVEHTNGAVTLLEVTFVPETSVTWRLHASLPAAAQSWQCRMSLEISFEQQNLNWVFKQHNIFSAEIIILCNFCWLWNFLFFCSGAVRIILLWFGFYNGKKITGLSKLVHQLAAISHFHTEKISASFAMQTHIHIIPGILNTFIPTSFRHTHSQGTRTQTPCMSKSSQAEDVNMWKWHQWMCNQ